MKQKKFDTLFFSALGVGLMFIIILAANVISGVFKQRVDLTAEKAYTLSPGTKAILAKLDTEVKIRLYVTQGDNAMPVVLKPYAQRVEDLLSEYKQAGNGKITIEKLNPAPDSDAEESAHLDGVEGQPLPPTGEKVYLGLAISQLDQKATLPFLTPERERLLEYDLSRAIAQVNTAEKPVVGVMTALPMFGQPMNPMMMMRGGQQGSEPWALISELKRDFTVRQLELNATQIDADVKVLFVAHPRDITEGTQYAIDQFLMRGGKLIAFLDPQAYFDNARGGNPMMGGGGGHSSMDALLKGWGLQMDGAKVVADLHYAGRTRQGDNPTLLMLAGEAINTNDIVTAQTDNLLQLFAGSFSGTPTPGLKQTVLLKSSAKSQLVDGMMASMAAEQIVKDFKASGTEQILAMRLSGKFKSAFPEGQPKGKAAALEEKDKAAQTDPSAPSLKESAQETTVILVGDTDMLNDNLSVQKQDFFGQRVITPVNGNLGFVQSSVEQLAGDSNLINLRSRAALNRPFTRVKQMESVAQEEYMSKIKALEADLAETQQRLTELQKSKDKGQKFILSPEQQAEVQKFQEKEKDARKTLKALRKRLKKDTDALQFWTKVMNIGAVPVAVALTGLVLAVAKRKRTAAK